MGAIEVVEKTQMTERPQMQAGDTVKVHVKVREGDKERIQVFEGIIIGMHRGGVRASFTVRKVSFGQGVERIFPLHSPIIQKVEVVRSAKVRRAKLYFLRDLKGKAARMREGREVESRGRGLTDPTYDARCRVPRRGRSRTSCASWASTACAASTKSAADAWPGRSWPARSCCTPIGILPGSAIRRPFRRPSARSCSSRSPSRALAWAVAEASPVEIDAINIHQASLQAMRRAVMSLAPLPDLVLVDAFRIPDLLMAQRGVVHGDQRCSAIAAASILAKVTRDRQMRELHAQDPRYGFDRHKGYATADHLAAVRQFGYSAVHRRSFSPPTLPLEFDTID